MDGKLFPAAKIASWYFRLNGFLSVENFVIHPECRGAQKTEADLCAVRFPNRDEMGMKDDALFNGKRLKPLFIIAEVTKGKCKLNGPWSNKEREILGYVLSAIGGFPIEEQKIIAEELYQHCLYPSDQTKEAEFRLIAAGKDIDPQLQEQYPHLKQITLKDMLAFIYVRFSDYRGRKADHDQWDCYGKELWTVSESARSQDDFATQLLERI